MGLYDIPYFTPYFSNYWIFLLSLVGFLIYKHSYLYLRSSRILSLLLQPLYYFTALSSQRWDFCFVWHKHFMDIELYCKIIIQKVWTILQCQLQSLPSPVLVLLAFPAFVCSLPRSLAPGGGLSKLLPRPWPWPQPSSRPDAPSSFQLQ